MLKPRLPGNRLRYPTPTAVGTDIVLGMRRRREVRASCLLASQAEWREGLGPNGQRAIEKSLRPCHRGIEADPQIVVVDRTGRIAACHADFLGPLSAAIDRSSWSSRVAQTRPHAPHDQYWTTESTSLTWTGRTVSNWLHCGQEGTARPRADSVASCADMALPLILPEGRILPLPRAVSIPLRALFGPLWLRQRRCGLQQASQHDLRVFADDEPFCLSSAPFRRLGLWFLGHFASRTTWERHPRARRAWLLLAS